jgi:outer membrane protein
MKMKKLAVVLITVFFCLAISVGSAISAEKLAYVDLSRIFSEYGKTKDYDKVLGDKEAVYTKERDTKVNEIKQLQDKMNLLSDKEKEAKKGELETKLKAVQEYDRQQQTDLRKEQDEKMKEILKDIEVAVQEIAQKEGYDLVFNDRVLVYQSKALNITDKVMEILNKNYKKTGK